MPSIQQALCEPSTGSNLARVQVFLDFLAARLSADDYAVAVDLLWASIDADYARNPSRPAA